MLTRKAVLAFILLFGAMVLLIGVSAGAQPLEGEREPTDWLLQGRVFVGDVGDESRPLAGVAVQLRGANNPWPDPGALILSTSTDASGWYGLNAPAGYEYYHIVEIDSAGYTSVGATTVSGTVVNHNRIIYSVSPVSLDDQTLTGNKFWDRPESPGWLQGQVRDAENGGTEPPCTPATVVTQPGNWGLPADLATGLYGPIDLVPGSYTLTASASGYYPQSVTGVEIVAFVTTTQDFDLQRPVIAVAPPDLVSVTAYISRETTFPLMISNPGSRPLNFQLGELPGELPWVWQDPISGTVPAGGSVPVDVTFHCTALRDFVGALQITHNDPCLGPVDVPIQLHCQEPPPPGWTKWIDQLPWQPDIRVTAETSDTIRVVDVVSSALFDPLRLVEQWEPENLALLDYQVTPAGTGVTTDNGLLVWDIPEGGQVYTLTKWFHVEPCTWLETMLHEELWRDAELLDYRPVTIVKQPPVLWIGSIFNSPVFAGEVATFTLAYGNLGGYENDVMIRNTFPLTAPLAYAAPAPDRQAPDGTWAEWDLGDLAGGAVGEIEVLVAIAVDLPPTTTIPIWDGIFNHVGELMGETFILYHVEPPIGGEWRKWVNGVPWNPDLFVTTQTSDTIEVLDVVTTLPAEGMMLVEHWDPIHLALQDFQVDPPAGTVVFLNPGELVWELPGGDPQVYTLTKTFHVEPCTWQITWLEELLFVDGVPNPRVRMVPIEKLLPDLWIDSDYSPDVFVGETAAFTLTYGNWGGREFGASIYNEFPETGRYVGSDPPPSQVDPAGLWARWELEPLETGQQGSINVVVEIAPILPPSTTISIWDVILNHAGEVMGEVETRFHVPFPPVTFPEGDWPWYAQEEITVEPEPPIPGRPTQVCAEVVNHDPLNPQPAVLEFSVANFGIGLPFAPVGTANVLVPAGGTAKGCIVWVPPAPGHWCIQARILGERYPYQISQRNIDMDEPLQPGVAHSLVFPVGNPLEHPVTITLGMIPLAPDWGLELDPDTLIGVAPGETRPVTLTVTPPGGQLMPPDGRPIVDVEAYHGAEIIGGFRKVFRPPVPLHRFPDPPYAEREITVHPYPPRAGEPTEVCVELRNPTALPQTVTVHFAWAKLGIGIPFTPINGPRVVHLPPHSTVRECLHWIPPIGGSLCVQVELAMEGYQLQRSRRNIDVDEPLQPGVPHSRVFPVGNPFGYPVTVTLGLVPHLPNWGLELSSDVLPNMAPGETRPVTLTVTPPAGQPLPPDNTAIVDVEAYVQGKLIGGFRKLFRPPVPIHRPRDPVYAESEIGIDPYPIIPGMPAHLSVEVYNPTAQDQVVTATFSIAPFGIGLPFSTLHITPNPIRIFVPAHGAARGHVVWQPPNWSGKFCVRVTLQIPGHEPIWSQRNIDVGEPLRPGVPHALDFPVGTWPHTGPVTVTLGLINHRPGWDISLSQHTLVNVQPYEPVTVTLTVTAPVDDGRSLETRLGTGMPIVDVEAYVDHELLGGFRKMDIPPVPLHKPHERQYAESEIRVDPYPPQLGVESRVSAVLMNTSNVPTTVNLEFGWAKFGMGIPFTTTGMVPPTRTLNLGPMMTTTAEVTWTPAQSGHQCILVRLNDAAGVYEEQWSQRNVDVEERPPCDATKVFSFTVYNDSPFTVTVQIGLATFNVPADWQVTTVPSDTLELGPFDEGVVTVFVTLPCPEDARAAMEQQAILELQQQAGSIPTIDVEGYIEGELVGGIEIQFAAGPPGHQLFLPLLLKNY